MQLFKNTLQINFLGKTKITSIISSILLIISICILFFKGLNLTVEFTGGTNLNVSLDKTTISDFRTNINTMVEYSIEVVEIENIDNTQSNFLLRTKFIEDENLIIEPLKNIYPSLVLNGIDSFGPKLGAELKTNARNAILLALLLISFYIAIRFDRYYALGSVAALIHDVLITMGILSILNLEIGITIIAALLTIVGYSLNDTIVVYDRIRENIAKLINNDRFNVVNRSLNEMLNRTVITSMTTLIVVLVLYFYGGSVLQPFAMTLIVGIMIGTYSSIFIASPIMLFFEEKYPIPEYKDEEEY
tara:strand:- start:1103 stop:2011 length:909 start_codon:yes stop_codon:yes gene_type:complete